jgi:hypothetical protein
MASDVSVVWSTIFRSPGMTTLNDSSMELRPRATIGLQVAVPNHFRLCLVSFSSFRSMPISWCLLKIHELSLKTRSMTRLQKMNTYDEWRQLVFYISTMPTVKPRIIAAFTSPNITAVLRLPPSAKTREVSLNCTLFNLDLHAQTSCWIDADFHGSFASHIFS